MPTNEVTPNAIRARKLLIGGLVGGHLAGLAAVLASWGWSGALAAASAAVAAAVTLVFFTIGQAVQLAVAEASARLVLVAALASYFVRVTALGLLLMVVLGEPERFGGLDAVAVVAATIAVVVGWLAGEIRAYSLLRIPVFDSMR